MIAVWHGHHNVLISWLDSIEDRVADIRANKPARELPTRERLMHAVVGELPAEVVTAWHASKTLWLAYETLWHGYATDCQTSETAWLAFDTAWQAYLTLYRQYLPEIEALHAQECPDCTWNGTSIFGEEAR